jgi:uncharacterized protein involved in type VI secretion and phage assembly
MMTPDPSTAEILDRLRNRFFGKYRGSVTEIDDATLRIKAKVPAILGEQATGWCVACVPYAGPAVGMAFLPEVGAGVWIEFEGGDVSYPIWSGCYWREGEYPEDAKGAVKVIVTKGGSKFVLDDDAGTISITDGNDNEITIDSSGIKLVRKSKSVAIGDSSVKINDSSLEVT